MPTLAPKLPYDHPFAGGYPRLGGQPLPTDPDAIDYLNRVKAADGAGVEVGVAMAVDAFVKGCKADSAGYAGDPTRTVWDALQASCIMCGARTISGALVPLKGTAPAPYNFVAADYDRSGGGLKGDGATKYLDSNRANNADGQDDNHNALYLGAAYANSGTIEMGASTTAGRNMINIGSPNVYMRCRDATEMDTGISSTGTGLVAFSRESSSGYSVRAFGSDYAAAAPSDGLTSDNVFVFALNSSGTAVVPSSARLAFYSIGSSLDLAALDNRVTQLINGIKFHSLTGLVATDYDPDTVAYIVAANEAGGTL